MGTASGAGGTVDLRSEMGDSSKAGRAAGSVGKPDQTSGHLLEVKLGERGGGGERPTEHRRQSKLENSPRSAARTPLKIRLEV